MPTECHILKVPIWATALHVERPLCASFSTGMLSLYSARMVRPRQLCPIVSGRTGRSRPGERRQCPYGEPEARGYYVHQLGTLVATLVART